MKDALHDSGELYLPSIFSRNFSIKLLPPRVLNSDTRPSNLISETFENELWAFLQSGGQEGGSNLKKGVQVQNGAGAARREK